MFSDFSDSETCSEDFIFEESRFLTDDYFKGLEENEEEKEEDLTEHFPIGAKPTNVEEEKFFHELYVYILRCIAYPLAFEGQKSESKRAKHDEFDFRFTKKSFETLKQKIKFELDSAKMKRRKVSDIYKSNQSLETIYFQTLDWYYENFLLKNATELINFRGHTVMDFFLVFKKKVKTLLCENNLGQKKNLEELYEKFRQFLPGKSAEEIGGNSNFTNPQFQPEKGGGGANKDILLNHIRCVFGMEESIHRKYINEYHVYDEDEHIEGIVQELNNRLAFLEQVQISSKLFVKSEMAERMKELSKSRIVHLLSKLGLGNSQISTGGADDGDGSVAQRNGHNWLAVHFNTETSCDFCGNVIWGLGKHGFRCLKCTKVCHKKCSHLGLECLFSKSGGPSESSTDGAKRNYLLPKMLKSQKYFSTSLKITINEAKGGGIFHSDKFTQNVIIQVEVSGIAFRTDIVPAANPVFNQQCVFEVHEPMPEVKMSILAASKAASLLNNSVLATILMRPVFGDKNTAVLEWYGQEKEASDPVKIRCKAEFGRPSYLTRSGWLWCNGGPYKSWRRRYFTILSTNQGLADSWALFEFKLRESTPSKGLSLKGHIVDYSSVEEEEEISLSVADQVTTSASFKLMAPGIKNTIYFCSEVEDDRQRWIHAFHRATTQSHVPKLIKEKRGVLPTSIVKMEEHDFNASSDGVLFVKVGEAAFEIEKYFETFLKMVYHYDLTQANGLGWLSPENEFLLNEFCWRYGILDIPKNCKYLQIQTNSLKYVAVDPLAMKSCVGSCLDCIRTQNVLTVTDNSTLLTSMNELKDHIIVQITSYKTCFPFGKPEGVLQTAMDLLEVIEQCKIQMEGRQTFFMNLVLKDELGKTAQKNFREFLFDASPLLREKMSKDAEITEDVLINSEKNQNSPAKFPQKPAYGLVSDYQDIHISFAELSQVARNMLDALNEDVLYFKDPFSKYLDIIAFNGGIYFGNFKQLMKTTLLHQPDVLQGVLELFVNLTSFLYENKIIIQELNASLMDLFSPIAIKYIDEQSILAIERIDAHIRDETWARVDGALRCSSSASKIFDFFQYIHKFIKRMKWPDAAFGDHLVQRIQAMMHDAVVYYTQCLERKLREFLAKENKEVSLISPEVCIIFNNVNFLRYKCSKFMEETQSQVSLKPPLKIDEAPAENSEPAKPAETPAFEGLIYDGTTAEVVLEGKYITSDEDMLKKGLKMYLYRTPLGLELTESLRNMLKLSLPTLNYAGYQIVAQMALLQPTEGFSVRSLISGGVNKDGRTMKKELTSFIQEKDNQLKFIRERCPREIFLLISEGIWKGLVCSMLEIFKSGNATVSDSDDYTSDDSYEKQLASRYQSSTDQPKKMPFVKKRSENANSRQVEFLDRALLYMKRILAKNEVPEEIIQHEKTKELEELIIFHQTSEK